MSGSILVENRAINMAILNGAIGGNGGQGARQSPRLARQALLRAPVDHLGLLDVAAEFSRARVYLDPVESCLNADRTFYGVWSARGGLLTRALFHQGAVQADVCRAARGLRQLLMVAHCYLTTAGGQVGNPKELGLAKSALKRLGDKYSPTLHNSARSAVLVANLPAFWRLVCDSAAEMDAENDHLHPLLHADATAPPAPLHLHQAPALPNPPAPQQPQVPAAPPVPVPVPAPGPPAPPARAHNIRPAGPVAQPRPPVNAIAPAPPAGPINGPGAASNVIVRRRAVAIRQPAQPVQGQGHAPGNGSNNVPQRRRAAPPAQQQQQVQQPPAARRRRSSSSSDSGSSSKRGRRQ